MKEIFSQQSKICRWNSEWLPDVLLAKTVERKAINLLNHPTALGPSYRLLQKKRRVISAAGRSTQDNLKNNYFRKIFGKVWLHEFQISNIYSHSAATSEKEWILSSHITKFKSCRSRASITYQIPRRWRQYRWSKT